MANVEKSLDTNKRVAVCVSVCVCVLQPSVQLQREETKACVFRLLSEDFFH